MNIANDTRWLTAFNVNLTSNSRKLYANGRQQVEISVSVTFRSRAIFTKEQLDNIRLVILDDNGAFQELSGELNVSTERDTRFHYYADTGAPPAPLLQPYSIRRRFYVSSTRPGGSLDRIYAAINKDRDTLYVSHTSVFNSSVEVESLTPLRLTRDDIEFSREDNHHQVVNATDWDYDVYQLSFKGRNLKMVQSVSYGTGSGYLYYSNVIEDYGYFADGEPRSNMHIAYAVGTQTKFRLPRSILSVRRRPASMVFIRIATHGPVTVSGDSRSLSQWGLIDQYGNEHMIEMTQEDNGNLIDFVMKQ